MQITNQGLQQVKDDLAQAIEAEKVAGVAYEIAVERVDNLREALECDHADVEETGSLSLIVTECKKCGFTWYD